jgi:thiosulfate dehydrogenase
MPFERQITSVPLQCPDRQGYARQFPVQANEATFVAGAKIYREQCAFCHGVYGNPSQVGKHMFPDAPPLWEKHPHGDVVA